MSEQAASSRAAVMTRAPRDNYLVFGAPLISEAAIAEVVDSLRSGWIGTGPKVGAFERAFREYIGASHAVALNSCTAALHLCQLVAGIGPGDEVITTAMTFVASANTVLHCGATPVLVDCDRDTGLLTPDAIEHAITPRTRAIMPVHLYGRACDMESIMAIAKKHSLIVIDDAAHAVESTYRGGKVGVTADMSCFSFYVNKNMTTGEGGMVTTANAEYADRLKVYGLHGMSKDAWKRFSDDGYKHYEVVFPGFKYNLTDTAAALGLHQLPHVPEWLVRRNEIWRAYTDAFADLPVTMQPEAEAGSVHARHLFTLGIDRERTGVSRDEFMTRMHRANIGTGVHYLGVHLHPYYRDLFGYKPEDFPNATWISERTVSLPLSPKLTDQDVDDVIDAVRGIIGGH